jgi:colicin import membrane protein
MSSSNLWLAAHLAAAQARANQAEAARVAAEVGRNAAVEAGRADAERRIAAAEVARDAAIAQASVETNQQISAAGADRDLALTRAEQAGQLTRLAQPEAARAQAAEQAGSEETSRVRADAARDRDELRADLSGPSRARRAPSQHSPR